MNIVLVRPSTVTSQDAAGQDAAPPLGIAYLAAVLLQTGHTVHIVDALGEGISEFRGVAGVPNALQHGISDEEVIDAIPEDTQLIGISCMFSLEWPFTRSLVEKISGRFPYVPIVAGGEHITACPDFVLEDCPAIDFCVLGEGEDTVAELAEALESHGDVKKIEGLVIREDGQFVHTPPRKRIRSVESLPRPAWQLVPMEAYLSNGVMTGVNIGRSMPMLASRGCPYQCTFCSNPAMWGNLWKARPPQDVFDEMVDYMREYSATNFDFYDLTAIVRKDWIVELAQLIIRSKLKLTWQLPSGTRSEAIDEEVTALLYESGCRYINYAPESGSEAVLKMIKKKIDKQRMLVSVRSAVKNGLKVKANFILGFPDETYRHVWETLGYIFQFALAGVHDAGVFNFSPYPGSELFNRLEKEGKIKLTDKYFYGLSQYTDPGITRSYSKHISHGGLQMLLLSTMMMFYGVQYTIRPWRFFELVSSVLRNRPKTKLDTALVRILERRRIRRNIENEKVLSPT